ncbi:MAG: DUF4406 domain-containing protein [Candidatus Amulumruptor caecigallinarius]|nr:DUF4406 domain-containing protein [Candidatus Amulumruptor caecigallinarius]MCM1397450.1 DUF4406 domain-containing protein [Candidatus Amulumruptor caecigallinarius]MCM1454343.1 DUF4406 domain-containing protein [bacterium]
MKIYISLPITGHDIAQCRALAADVARIVTKRGHRAVTPFDVCPEADRPYSYYIGKDIAALLECDAALFIGNWAKSKGCSLEYKCAQIYGIRSYHHLEQIPNQYK